ncbi:ANGPT2 [Branchiostoma lanceolatum]|uniref:ANGPT2 protein n=1 Tax=Branchiostoma lanceolatum TaxID=7740 RepID=A0A8K0E9U2_BRALA|nr:ANGPT2 [Branchiostoma lanceolatum]
MATKGWAFVLFFIATDVTSSGTSTSPSDSPAEHGCMDGLRHAVNNGHAAFIFKDVLSGHWSPPSRASMDYFQLSMDRQKNSLSAVGALLDKMKVKDCGEIYQKSKGPMDSGIYTIYPRSSDGENNSAPLRVFCRVEAGRAWTVIQRRQDGSVDFYNRTWEDYSRGFGNLTGEFWLGNDNIHVLTNQGSSTLNMANKGWAFVLLVIATDVTSPGTNTSPSDSPAEHGCMDGLRHAVNNGHATFIFKDVLTGHWNPTSRASMDYFQLSMDHEKNSLFAVGALLDKMKPKDCGEIYQNSKGPLDSGIYTIYPRSSGGENNSAPLRVFCRVEAGRAWTVIQRRQDGSVDFYNRTWEDYSRGFGNLTGEFWLGNDNIHVLTNQGSCTLNMANKGWVFVLLVIATEVITSPGTNPSPSRSDSPAEHAACTHGLRHADDDGHGTFIFSDVLSGFAGHHWIPPSQASMECLQLSMDQQKIFLSAVGALVDNKTPKDCGEIYRDSKSRMDSGIYTIYPRSSFVPLRVFCRVEAGRAWTVIQRRQDGSVDFYDRTWEDYSRGFGNLTGEFWLGNDNIHLLTNQGSDSGVIRELTRLAFGRVGWRSAESAGVRLRQPNVLKVSKHSALDGGYEMGRLVFGWCSARSASARLVFGIESVVKLEP